MCVCECVLWYTQIHFFFFTFNHLYLVQWNIFGFGFAFRSTSFYLSIWFELIVYVYTFRNPSS